MLDASQGWYDAAIDPDSSPYGKVRLQKYAEDYLDYIPLSYELIESFYERTVDTVREHPTVSSYIDPQWVPPSSTSQPKNAMAGQSGCTMFNGYVFRTQLGSSSPAQYASPYSELACLRKPDIVDIGYMNKSDTRHSYFSFRRRNRIDVYGNGTSFTQISGLTYHMSFSISYGCIRNIWDSFMDSPVAVRTDDGLFMATARCYDGYHATLVISAYDFVSGELMEMSIGHNADGYSGFDDSGAYCTFGSAEAASFFTSYDWSSHPLTIITESALDMVEMRAAVPSWEAGAGAIGTTKYTAFMRQSIGGSDVLTATKMMVGHDYAILDGSTLCEFEVDKNGSDEGCYTVGSVASSTLTVKAITCGYDGSDLPSRLSGLQAIPYIGYYVGEEIEWCPLGVFFVDASSISVSGITTSFSGFDFMSHAMSLRQISVIRNSSYDSSYRYSYKDGIGEDRSYYVRSSTYGIGNNVRALNTFYQHSSSMFYKGNAAVSNHLNDSDAADVLIPTGNSVCIRDILSRIAVSCGGNAVANQNGTVRIAKPTWECIEDGNGDEIVLPAGGVGEIYFDSTEDSVISGVKFIADNDDGTQTEWNYAPDAGAVGCYLQFDETFFSNKGSRQSWFNEAAQRIMTREGSDTPQPISYRGFEVDSFVAPFIEPYDSVKIENYDIFGELNTHLLTPFMVKISYNGSLRVRLSAESVEYEDNVIPSGTSISASAVQGLARVAATGDYGDLSGAPISAVSSGTSTVTIPAGSSNATLSVQFENAMQSAPNVIACFSGALSRYRGASLSVSYISSSGFNVNVYADSPVQSSSDYTVRWIAII